MNRRPYQQTVLDEFIHGNSRFWALLWERQAGKSTTLAELALYEMIKFPGRTVIYASASLLLSQEITVKAAIRANQTVEQLVEEDAARLKAFADNAQSIIEAPAGAQHSFPEVAALLKKNSRAKRRRAQVPLHRFSQKLSWPKPGNLAAILPSLQEADNMVEFKTFDSSTDKELIGGSGANAKRLSAASFAELFSQQRLEFRIYHSPTLYSRTKVIAPNIATARSWSGTVLLDEVAFIRNFRELVTALLPVISTDKNFKLILSTTPPEFDDTHYSFELLAPPTGLEFKPSAEGNWYTSESGVRVHRADAFDTALAGKRIFDLKSGEEITPTEAFNRAPNKDGHRIAHWLAWMHGGAAACDFAHLKTAQERGSGRHTTGPLCQNFHINSDADLTPALNWLSDNLGRTADGRIHTAPQKPKMSIGAVLAQYRAALGVPINRSDPIERTLYADYPTPDSGSSGTGVPPVSGSGGALSLRIGLGFDVATTTRGKSNPSVVSVMEEHGVEWLVRARFIWKTRDPEVASQRLTSILDVLERRGIRPRALVQDATNERYYAEQNRQRFKSRVPVILIVGSQAVENAALDKPTNWKEYLGNQLVARLDDNNLTLPPDDYTRVDYRLVMKDRGKFVCEPNDQGMHGDCFDADKLAGHALSDLRKNRTVVAPITEADRLMYERERVKVPG